MNIWVGKDARFEEKRNWKEEVETQARGDEARWGEKKGEDGGTLSLVSAAAATTTPKIRYSSTSTASHVAVAVDTFDMSS